MSIESAIVVARLLEYLAIAALVGVPFLLIHGDPRTTGPTIDRLAWRTALLAAIIGLVGTAGWTVAQTALMAGEWRQALDPGALGSVLTDTPFGEAAVVRAVAIVVALIVLAWSRRPGFRRFAAVMALGAVAAGSLAWSGHGTAGEGVAGTMHLVADVVHLLAASVWVGALIGFLFMVAPVRQLNDHDVETCHRALTRFSGVGSAAVAALVLTGLVNSWFLVGPNHVGSLLTTLYGQLLAAKLALFGLMLALAAANRFRLVPALGRSMTDCARRPSALRTIRRSLYVEAALGFGVTALVSWLGTLAAPIDAM